MATLGTVIFAVSVALFVSVAVTGEPWIVVAYGFVLVSLASFLWMSAWGWLLNGASDERA